LHLNKFSTAAVHLNMLSAAVALQHTLRCSSPSSTRSQPKQDACLPARQSSIEGIATSSQSSRDSYSTEPLNFSLRSCVLRGIFAALVISANLVVLCNCERTIHINQHNASGYACRNDRNAQIAKTYLTEKSSITPLLTLRWTGLHQRALSSCQQRHFAAVLPKIKLEHLRPFPAPA
jgi:hypothetical protein